VLFLAADVVIELTARDAWLARHRDELWSVGLRAALLRARAKQITRRSRWEARRARRLLHKHVLRGAAKTAPPRRKAARRRSRARLIVVT